MVISPSINIPVLHTAISPTIIVIVIIIIIEQSIIKSQLSVF
jgi:hypothetical protein